jgi:hypothetical protein
VIRVLLTLATLSAAVPFHSDVRKLTPDERHVLVQRGFWHHGCPVARGDLRVLETSYYDFHHKPQTGRLVVNRTAAHPLARVFRKLWRTHFRVHHMRFADMYGPRSGRPQDGDVTQSFECREAVPSPCSGGSGTGTWSNHAYGLAVDVNPLENPYVGCGQSRDPATRPYFDRSRHRRGMVRGKVIRAFRSIGWGWGGAWTGDTKDYMHFSFNGH